MTQPPPPPPNQPPGPPPNQPPGGFGAPTPPPQGQPDHGHGYGYGHPQAPQPGYGYPQGPQAPQAPQTQPGYGYNYGYGRPQQPVPPHAHPTAPEQYAVKAAGPGGGGRGKLSAQAQIIIAAVVAVVLIVGGGVWYANSGDDAPTDAKGTGTGQTPGGGGDTAGGAGNGLGGDGKEKPGASTEGRLAFRVDTPTVPDTTPVNGSWLTDKVFVKTGVNAVVGYDRDTGAVAWTLPLPGQVCGASRHMTADRRAPILFEAAKRVAPRYYQHCTEVGMVDLDTGRLVWSKSVSGGSAGDRKVRFSEVTLSGATVAAGGSDGGAAFAAADGKPRWKPQVNTDNCYDMGYAGGPALVAVRKCGTYGSESVLVQSLDATSGQPLSQYKMPPGVKYAAVVSTKPLVVAADVGGTAGDGSGISDFFSIDEKTGKLRAKIAASGDRYAARCGSTKVEACSQALVGNDRLYVPTEEHEGSTGEYSDRTNEIVAFDLKTGRPVPEKADAGDKYTLIPLRMDGGDLIAYKEPPYDKGGQIVSIHGGTMKETLLLENPSDKPARDVETSFSVTGSEFLYGDGRFFISSVYANKTRPSDSTYGKRYLVAAFTAR